MPRHLPRTGSTTFRIVWALALLAWSGFALAAPRVAGVMADAAAMSAPAADAPAAHACDGMGMPGGAPHAPANPHACCQGGCHCLPAAGALPAAATRVRAQSLPAAAPSHPGCVKVFAAPAAPPLRPPIG